MDKILNNINKNEEFEILYNVKNKNTLNDIHNLSEYFNKICKKKPNKIIILDIIYNHFRISIKSLDDINIIYKKLKNIYSNTDILNEILQFQNIDIYKKKKYY